MPIMDGFNAAKTIRTIEKTLGLSPIQIYALSANVMEVEKERVIQAGMDFYLTKPISRAELAKIFKQL